MIQVNELRIGNKVILMHDSGVKSIEAVSGLLRDYVLLSDESTSPKKLDDIRPIPLTQEILKDCGFIFTGDDWYELKTTFGKINFNLKFKTCSLSDNDYTNECMLSDYDSVKYVHQLQNICFFITGKELDIIL